MLIYSYGINCVLFADNMPPQGQTGGSWVLYETDAVNTDTDAPVIVPPSAEKREWKIVWRNVILMGMLHIGGVYGAYLFLTKAMWLTDLFGMFFACSSIKYRAILAEESSFFLHVSFYRCWGLFLRMEVSYSVIFQVFLLTISKNIIFLYPRLQSLRKIESQWVFHLLFIQY